MFRVGQKVVCIDDREPIILPGYLPGMDGLTRGRIYTVRRAGLCSEYDGRPAICLYEINRLFDSPYWAHRFRPIVERKTSIAIFTAILTPSPTKREHVA